MFEEIGKKIKILAKISFILEVIVSLVCGIVYAYVGVNANKTIYYGNNTTFEIKFVFGGVGIFLIGVIIAWISNFVLYGFGELVDKVCDIADDVREIKSNTKDKGEGLDKIKTIKLDEYER